MESFTGSLGNSQVCVKLFSTLYKNEWHQQGFFQQVRTEALVFPTLLSDCADRKKVT